MNEIVENSPNQFRKICQELRATRKREPLEKIRDILKQNKDTFFYDEERFKYVDLADITYINTQFLIDTELQIEIFKLFIDGFFVSNEKIKKIKNADKFSFFHFILNYNTNFFKSTICSLDFFDFLSIFFSKYYPKKKELELKEGVIYDVLIKEPLTELKMNIIGWIQLPIKRIDDNKVFFDSYNYAEEERGEFFLEKNSFRIYEKNTFIKDEEMLWRKGLKIGDKIDYLNKKVIWVRAEIIEVFENKVAFVCLGDTKDNKIIKYKYSIFIKPYKTFSFDYNESEAKYIEKLKINKYTNFTYVLPTPKYSIDKDDVNYLTAYVDGIYSIIFFDLENYLMNKLVRSKILDEIDDDFSFESIYIILSIFSFGFNSMHYKFLENIFKEKLFPKIKKIMLKISVDKSPNPNMNDVLTFFAFIFQILGPIDFEFRNRQIMMEFFLNFGFNCFSMNEVMPKRLTGLQSIISALEQYVLIDSEYPNKNLIKDIRNIILNKKDDKKDLLELLFNTTTSLHEELLLKGKEIIIILFRCELLNDDDINRLYNFAISSQEETETCNHLYNILEFFSKNNINYIQAQNIIKKVISLPIDKVKKKDIYFLFSIIEKLKGQNGYRSDINSALDFIYKFIHNNIDNANDYYHDFTQASQKMNIDDNNIYFIELYSNRIINELLNTKSPKETVFLYKLFSYFIYSMKNKKLGEQLRPKIVELLSKNNNSKQLIQNIFSNIEESKEEITLEQKLKYYDDIINILCDIEQYSKYSSLLDIETIMKFFDIFIFSQQIPSDNSQLLDCVYYLKSYDLIDAEKFSENFFKKLDEFLSKINKENQPLYKDILNISLGDVVNQFYKDVNNIKTSDGDNVYIDENCYIQINPLECKYFDIVWKLFTKINLEEFIEEFLILFGLRLFSLEEKYQIWQKFIKKIFDEIENFIEPETPINILNLLINCSEKYGTGGAISYTAEKIKKFPLKINIKMDEYLSYDFNIFNDIYTNSTIYDLKKLIYKNISIDPLFIKIIKPNLSYSNINNGETLYSLLDLEKHFKSNIDPNTNPKLTKIYQIKIEFSDDFYSMFKYKLIDEEDTNKFDEKMINVISNIFDKITKNTKKLDITMFSDYIEKINNNDKNSAFNQKAKFKVFDSNNKGYWVLEDFINFFFDEFKENGDRYIYRMIRYSGYGNDLEPINQPLNILSPCYYIENDKSNFMPRYFIGKNPEYMKKIFEFSTKSEKLREICNELINKLSTMTSIKDLFFDENKNNKSEKIVDDLLKNDNIEMNTYIFNIILFEFEKNNDICDKYIDDAIYFFIEKNIEKLIDSLDEYINKLKEQINKEKLNYFKYYNYCKIIIQIILFSLKKLINKPNFSQEIFYPSNEEDSNEETIILKFISELNIESQKIEILKNINYNKLMNIIIYFLTLIIDQANITKEEKEDNFNILLIIFILLEKDYINNIDDKNIIYKNFISNIGNICNTQIIDNHILIENYFSLIIFIKKSDEKFVSITKDEIGKEILKYDKYDKLKYFRYEIFFFF